MNGLKKIAWLLLIVLGNNQIFNMVAPQKTTSSVVGGLNIWRSAREGELAKVQNWVKQVKQQGASIDEKDSEGYTPLAWAAIKQQKPIINFLIANGANVNAVNNDEQSILENAINRGDLEIIKTLLDNGANANYRGTKKGRNALSQAIRAHKDSLIHVYDLEQDPALAKRKISIENEAQFMNELPNALADLTRKEQLKLSTAQIVEILKLIRYPRLGNRRADISVPDAEGNTVEYYINFSMILPEVDRVALLNALGVSITPRKFIGTDVADALAWVENILGGLLQKLPDLKNKIQKVLWALKAARSDNRKIDILRIAMALLANTRKTAEDQMEAQGRALSKDITILFDTARTLLRDAILLLKSPQDVRREQAVQEPRVQKQEAHRAAAAKEAIPNWADQTFNNAIARSDWAHVMSVIKAHAQPASLDYITSIIEKNPNFAPHIKDWTYGEARYTPLFYAAMKDRIMAMEILLNAGANLHYAVAPNVTPLVIATAGNNLLAIDLLLRRGANINDLVWQIAREDAGKKEIVRLLEAYTQLNQTRKELGLIG